MTQPAPSAQHNGSDKGALAAPSDTPPPKTGGRGPALGLRLDVRILSLLGVLAVLILVGGVTEPDAFPGHAGTSSSSSPRRPSSASSPSA
ncbi:hypothetical protein SCALM49S_05798 [Streptomyces californicus]